MTGFEHELAGLIDRWATRNTSAALIKGLEGVLETVRMEADCELPDPPHSPLDPDDGQPMWAQMVDLFRKHGMEIPPIRLRDELVVHLMWARFGEAMSKRLDQ